MADSVIDLRYTNASKVSSFPVENGSFTDYNKVRTPYKAKVRLAVGGDTVRIEAFINEIDRVVEDVNLYNVVTPEHVYLNANIEHASYSRAHNKGKNLILVDLELIEIRQVTPQYISVSIPNAKKPGDKGKKNTGKHQPQPPPQDLKNYSKAEVIRYQAEGYKLGQFPPPHDVPLGIH